MVAIPFFRAASLISAWPAPGNKGADGIVDGHDFRDNHAPFIARPLASFAAAHPVYKITFKFDTAMLFLGGLIRLFAFLAKTPREALSHDQDQRRRQKIMRDPDVDQPGDRGSGVVGMQGT